MDICIDRDKDQKTRRGPSVWTRRYNACCCHYAFIKVLSEGKLTSKGQTTYFSRLLQLALVSLHLSTAHLHPDGTVSSTESVNSLKSCLWKIFDVWGEMTAASKLLVSSIQLKMSTCWSVNCLLIFQFITLSQTTHSLLRPRQVFRSAILHDTVSVKDFFPKAYSTYIFCITYLHIQL